VLLASGSPAVLRAMAWYGMRAGACANKIALMSNASVVRVRRMGYGLGEDNYG